jgi:class 3 adenylate cyclase/tetratricopeptide (TPR) repeat protein
MEGDAPSRDSERRQATILFADIAGFTAMSEKMDPEDVTTVMNECFAMMEESVRGHGGIVDKFIGDCIMALFGVPNAIENAPRQAVNAAIDMRNRLAQLRDRDHISVPLDLHVGINTGLVVAGQVGGAAKRDFTVMGDAVNLASRLKDIAASGAIYVGPDTYRSTRTEFDYREQKPILLKGKERPVTPYEVLSVTEQVHRRRIDQPESGIGSTLIGREPELERLHSRLSELARGRGGVLAVVGEPGMGKSRLLAELAPIEVSSQITLIEGRSLSVGEGLSFHPFVDLLQRWVGISEADTEGEALAKLEREVVQLCGSDTQPVEVFPYLATVMGLRLPGAEAQRLAEIEGEALEKLIARSVRELIQMLAERRPLGLVFEDVHWADMSSVKLLESLFRLALETPVLFLLVLRPDHAETGERLRRSAGGICGEAYDEIHVEPLDAVASDRLAQNLVWQHDLGHSLRSLIVRKAEGNPFFIEEVIRSLVDQGTLAFKDGRLRAASRVDTVVIPETIQGVIMARIDRLPEPARRLLQIASVIGRTFHHRLLAEVVGDDAYLNETLDYLRERQLITERFSRETASVRRSTFEAQRELRFKHALIQETTYESILHRTRKDLHGRVAVAIETLFTGRLQDFYAMLAYHFSRAEEPAKAEEYLFKAGDEAARSAASTEALNFFREASRLYFQIHGERGDPHKKALLEKNIGLALLTKGDLSESIEHFDRALGYLGEAVPRSRARLRLRFTTDLAAVFYHLYVHRGPPRGGAVDAKKRELLSVAYYKNLAQSTNDPERYFADAIRSIRRVLTADADIFEDACGVCSAGAAFFSFLGISFTTARRLLEVAEKLVRPGNLRDEVSFRTMRFLHYYLEGEWDDRYDLDDDLVEQALRYGRHWHVNTYLDLNCERLLFRGDFPGASRLLDRIVDISDGYGYDFAESSRLGLTGLLRLERRELPEALRSLDVYLSTRREDLLNLRGLGNKAKTQLLLGDREGASRTLADAEALRHRLGRVPPFHSSALLMARCLFDLGELEDSCRSGRPDSRTAKRARASVRKAVQVATKIARERVEAYTLAGRLNWLLNRQRAALAWWRKALVEGERLGARPAVARTLEELSVRLSETDRAPADLDGFDAAACLERAREIFAAIGLDGDCPPANSGDGSRSSPEPARRSLAGS